jgi:iron complex outermembrane recepter protein
MTFLRVVPLALALTMSAYAENNETDDGIDEESIEEVIVTGSRIKRDEYSSASPIQIIDGQGSRELGLIDTASLLQSATQATGTQIDNTFTAFVLDNGPGSAQVNLRGLGAERVLLLLNSKRVAPGGVGGAPTSPDISTIPNIMIDRIEYLLDGASSIYGSDAVSGVANVIMRSDFDGFEFEGQMVNPDAVGGGESTLGIAWGKSGDNWNLGISAEYYDRERLRLRDRPFTSQCNRLIYEDENGRELNDYLGLVPGTTTSPCSLSTINRVFIPVGYGNVWYTPGSSNIGIPNFSETEVDVGFTGFNPGAIIPTDTNGDGIPDTGLIDPDGNGVSEVDLQTDQYNFNGSARDRAGDLLLGSERTNFYAYGDYDLGNDSNTSLYFETLYAKRETEVFSPGATIFPEVPANNPFNPCNQDAGGVNCIGFFGGLNFGNLEVTPIIAVRNDRDNNKVEMEQLRLVGGIRGDLPGWQNNKGLGNWGYDVYYSHSTSEGTDVQTGILEDPLTLSLETSVIDGAGNITCGNGAPCVPVNMFADSLYQPGGGTFGSQAETDFVFGIRSFNTEVEQTVFSGVLQGDIAELPWNNTPIPLVVGFEWREDSIDSRPNDVARDGGFIAFFKDAGAKGDRDITELFIETELQLLEDVKYAEELSLNAAMRWTDESTYGDDTTYSVKGVYTPFGGLTFRGTYGTSFRAPNANEQFLAGQSGFTTVFDPCIIPSDAVIPALDPNVPGTYDASNDGRSQTVLDNCTANGVDPTTLGLDGTLAQYSVEVLRKGGQQVQLEIDPETSTSYTYGVVYDQQFWDEFTLRLGVTYYDIEVEDSISLLGTGFIVNDCYAESENNSSAFCRFINRDADGLIDVVDSSFVNINALSSSGIDYNVYYQRDFIVADRNLDLEVDLRLTRVMENLFKFEGSEEDDAGTPVAPEWEGTLLLTASYGDFRVNWRANYIAGETDTREAFAVNPACDTLSVLCRPIAKTDYYWNHTASVTWTPRDWTFTVGLVNVTDQDPPLMDDSAPEVQLNNVPLGAGYDLLGRRVFASVSKRF